MRCYFGHSIAQNGTFKSGTIDGRPETQLAAASVMRTCDRKLSAPSFLLPQTGNQGKVDTKLPQHWPLDQKTVYFFCFNHQQKNSEGRNNAAVLEAGILNSAINIGQLNRQHLTGNLRQRQQQLLEEPIQFKKLAREFGGQ